MVSVDNSTHKQGSRKQLFSWALYDWGNSAFATTVMSGFFPLFFKQHWSQGVSATTSTFYLGLGNTIASLIVVVAAPVLGALADQGRLSKRFIASFACTGCLVCIGVFFVAAGMWPLAIMLYMIGVIGFSGANVFYDAMLVIVSPDESRHRDSAIGYALGYLGGGLLFLLNVVMILKPHLFGLTNSTDAVRWSFVTVAIWWSVFTVPLLLFVKDERKDNNNTSLLSITRSAFISLRSTLGQVRAYKNVWLFLLAYWLYIDGVVTIIKMGIDYGIAIGLPSNSLILALLMVQFIGFPSTLLFGYLARKAPLKWLWAVLWIYVISATYAYFMDTITEFFILAAILGLVQGAVQSISRSFYSQIIPTDKVGEFFGFQNMVGKAAAVFGPTLVGTTAYLTGNSRLGFVSIVGLFIGGMLILRLVNPSENEPDQHTGRKTLKQS